METLQDAGSTPATSTNHCSSLELIILHFYEEYQWVIVIQKPIIFNWVSLDLTALWGLMDTYRDT